MKHLGKLTKGLGGTAIQGGVGAAAFYLHRMLSTKVDAVAKHPLLAPAAMLAAGHILKSKPKFASVGSALCGIAGYAGAQVFELSKASTVANTPTTSGFGDDTGALVSPGDIGALVSPSDIGAIAYDGSFTPNNASAYADAENL